MRNNRANQWFEPKQDRARPTVEALLNAAIDELREYGPSGLRQDRVLAASGAAQGSLYHHFGSRDGLIDAAYATVFTRSTEALLAQVRTSLEEASGVDDLTQRLLGFIDYMISDENTEARHDRIAVLAAATTRPSLAALVATEQHRITAELAEIIADLQRSGLIKPELDAAAIATFVQAYSLGQIILNVDSEPPALEAWREVVVNALSCLMNPSAT